METLTEVPLRTVHAYETDEDTVLKIELPVDEPKLTLALDDHTLTIRQPRRAENERFRMNCDVTGV